MTKDLVVDHYSDFLVLNQSAALYSCKILFSYEKFCLSCLPLKRTVIVLCFVLETSKRKPILTF